MKKVCATGPGLATPVVSITTRSKSISPASRRLISCDSAAARSPRMVQQMQPLLICTICSRPSCRQDLVVDVLFAELVLDHGDLHAVLLVQDALEQRGLAAAEEARQDGDRDQFGHCRSPWKGKARRRTGGRCRLVYSGCAGAACRAGSVRAPHSAQMPLTVSSTCSTAKPPGHARGVQPGRHAAVVQAEGAVAARAVEMAVPAMDGRAPPRARQAEAEDAVVAGALLRQALFDQPVEHAVDGHAVDGFAGGGNAVEHRLVESGLRRCRSGRPGCTGAAASRARPAAAGVRARRPGRLRPRAGRARSRRVGHDPI